MQENEHDKLWSLYLAHSSNALMEPISFDDYKSKLLGPNSFNGEKSDKVPNKKQKIGLSKADVEIQVNKSDSVLRSFTPPGKGEKAK